MIRLSILMTSAALVFCMPIAGAEAGVEKFIAVCRGQTDAKRLCPTFKSDVAAPAGWLRDEEGSARFVVSVFVPKGSRFAEAPAIIYAEAVYNKDRIALATWVETSNDRWLAAGKGARIAELPSSTADVIIARYENPTLSTQPFEVIAHYTDTDKDKNAYVIRLAISGLDAAAVEAARPALEQMLSRRAQ